LTFEYSESELEVKIKSLEAILLLTVGFDIKKAKEPFFFAFKHLMFLTKTKNDRRMLQRISLFDVTSSQVRTRSCGCKRQTLTVHKKSRFHTNREILAVFYSEKYGDFVELIKFFGVIGTLR